MNSASRVSDVELRNVRADDFSFQSFEDRIISIWKERLPIAACAIIAALSGYLVESLIFREYETSVVIRPQASPALMELSTVVSGANSAWYGIDNISDSAFDLFLKTAQDIGAREQALLANRQMFPGVDLDARRALSRLDDKFSVVVADGKTGAVGKSASLLLRSKKDWQAAAFLDRYVTDLTAATANAMIEGGRTALEAVRSGYQRDMDRLRAQRDIAAKQSALLYGEAMKTAAAAGIEGPVTSSVTGAVANAGSAAQLPLFYYGRKILEHEISNIESHIGNDLAIPEFAAIQASIRDVDSKLAALARIKFQPVVISQAAVDSGRVATPSPVGIILLCFALGGMCGYVVGAVRTRRRQTAEFSEFAREVANDRSPPSHATASLGDVLRETVASGGRR